MLIPNCPMWVAAVVCGLFFVRSTIGVIKARAAAEVVSGVEETVKAQSLFVKALTVDAETLMARAETEEIKAECRKVYEAIRYSDPVSSDALSAAESQITLKFTDLTNAVVANDLAAVQTAARETIILVEDRNKKCKLLK